jgi:uncharacterized caspase-like protein
MSSGVLRTVLCFHFIRKWPKWGTKEGLSAGSREIVPESRHHSRPLFSTAARGPPQANNLLFYFRNAGFAAHCSESG